MQKIIFLALFFLSINCLRAQTNIYQGTDNTGLNKKERIDNMETYLTQLSSAVKKIEAKLDENDKKFKAFDEVLKALRSKADDSVKNKLGEEKMDKSSNPEIAKLQTELNSLKSKDIEKLKTEVQGLTDTIKSLQMIMKSQKF